MCHGLQVTTRPRVGADQWSAIVDDMVSRGAQGTDDEFELIVKYLAANFGPANKGAAAQKVEINTATAKELVDGLGISESDAGAIVAYRKEKGAFKELADLKKVEKVDWSKLEAQKERIAFSPPPAGDRK
jgi:competence protein ComEA